MSLDRLSSQITVCLTSCGELTEKSCIQAIEGFRDRVNYIEVRNVFPQIAALQRMSELATTEYLIPLDADIILYPDSWDRILVALDKHHKNPSWHSILFPLFDTLTQKKILALKIIRVKALRAIPFPNNPTPDVDHFKQLTEAGWTCIHSYLERRPVGDHVVIGKKFCYNKYRDVYMTLRHHGDAWDSGVFLGGHDLRSRSKFHFDYFIHRYLESDNEDYLWCIAGMIDGITAPQEHTSKSLRSDIFAVSKDYAVDAYMAWYINGTYQLNDSVV